MLKGLRVGSFRGRLYFKTLVMFFMCTIYENYFSSLEEFGEKNEVLGSLKFIFLFFLTKDTKYTGTCIPPFAIERAPCVLYLFVSYYET